MQKTLGILPLLLPTCSLALGPHLQQILPRLLQQAPVRLCFCFYSDPNNIVEHSSRMMLSKLNSRACYFSTQSNPMKHFSQRKPNCLKGSAKPFLVWPTSKPSPTAYTCPHLLSHSHGDLLSFSQDSTVPQVDSALAVPSAWSVPSHPSCNTNAATSLRTFELGLRFYPCVPFLPPL